MGIWPFRRSRAAEDAERLLATLVPIARQPAFFGPGRAADTIEGRFELVALHASLILIRLKAEAGLEPLAQSFTDKFFRWIDAGLREAGVGDLTVPKKMHKLAGGFYGRLSAYSEALGRKDGPALEAALERNGAAGPDFATALAGYVLQAAAVQAAAPVEALMRLDGWPAAPA